MKIERFDVHHERYLYEIDADGELCYYKDVAKLVTQNEQLRALLQRVIDEKKKRRVNLNSNWLATSHNGDSYAEETTINSFLLNAIQQALNPDWEPR